MNIDNFEIYGFKANITDVRKTLDFIENLKKDYNCIIQIFDAKHIATKNHIRHSIYQAINAFNRKKNLANDFSVEMILRASAQRQISKAFNILGIKKGKMDLCIVIYNPSSEIYNELSSKFTRDDSVLSSDTSILQKVYDISDEELSIIHIENILIDKITKLNVDY